MNAKPRDERRAASGDADGGPAPGWHDRQLVARCLRGDERAWNALVDKYSRLVYAVILRYGIDVDDAADLFQNVWLAVHSDLEKLRKLDSLRSWLITVTRRRCYHWRKGQRRRESVILSSDEDPPEMAVDPVELADIEMDQRVRESVFRLPSRCQEMIRMLFFADPPKPYREVARSLGLAVGSIGFIRGRCLRKLQRIMESSGLV